MPAWFRSNDALGTRNSEVTGMLRARSYSLLALIHQALHNYEEALQQGQRALIEAESVEGEKIRTNLIAHATLNLAHVNKEVGAFDRALSLYDRSIELHRQLKLSLYVAEAHRGKLETLLALKDEPAIGEEIKTATELLEEDRSRITEDASRDRYFDPAQSTYDLAIDFTYSKLHDQRSAFSFSEASRARSLLDLVSAGGQVVKKQEGVDIRVNAVSRPLALDEIQRRLPEHCRVLQYSVLKDKVIAWVISKSSVESFHRAMTLDDLTENVNAFLGALTKEHTTNVDDHNSSAKLLYETLITPVSPSLNPDDVIFIVPDKILNYLSFAALVCPESRGYFVEDYRFEMAPSSTIISNCSDRVRERQRRATRKCWPSATRASITSVFLRSPTCRLRPGRPSRLQACTLGRRSPDKTHRRYA